MKTLCDWLLVLGVSALLMFTAGCGGQRVVWSPDGTRGAVFGDRGLYLCDGEGKISGLLVSNATMAGWFSDSGRLAVICDSKFDSWVKLEKHLDETNCSRIAHYAEVSGGADDLSDNEKDAVAIYRKGKQTVDVWELRVGTVNDNQVSLGPVLFQTLQTPNPMSTRVSPNGKDILLTTDGGKQDGGWLYMVPTDGSAAAEVVCDEAAAYPDWTKDGRSVVYIRAMGGMTEENDLRVGCLTRRQVIDSTGAVRMQTNTNLAYVLADSAFGVRCLGDGRILFVSADLHLPMTAADMPNNAEIFAFDPQRQATIARVVPRQAEEAFQNAGFLELSPDEKKVLIAGDKGAVSVFTIANGDVAVVQKPGADDAPSFPTWRGDEVCFMAPAPTNTLRHKWEVALWTEGHTKLLSARWPAEITTGFLDK